MKYLITLHLIGMLLVWGSMWNSIWRKKAQGEGNLTLYILGGIAIGLLWEPFLIVAIWKDIK